EASTHFLCDTDTLLGGGFSSLNLLSESPSRFPIAARYYTPCRPILQIWATPAEAHVLAKTNMGNGIARTAAHLLTNPRLRQIPTRGKLLAVDVFKSLLLERRNCAGFTCHVSPC